MSYNFDQVINRQHTNSLKYDFGLKRKNREDLLPLWVADMDFKLPDEVLKPLEEVIQFGIFGYSDPTEAYYNAVINWFKDHHQWSIEAQEITITPGVVYALSCCVNAYTAVGETIMISQPVYYPFKEVIEDNGRMLINNELVYQNGYYTINFEDLENKIIENDVKMYILCSPHNPVGRVWSKDELIQLGNICLKHHVLVVADEIHCDFTYGKKHTPFASINEAFKNHCVVCTSPSKTFNIAGFQIANIVIPNEQLRLLFRKQNAAMGYSQANIIGLKAVESVYQHGEAWYQELLIYLQDNIQYVKAYLKQYLPDIKLIEPEGTYLLWLDFNGLKITERELEALILKAKLWLDAGHIFSNQTAMFQRINIACPRSLLTQALNQLKQAIEGGE